MNKIGYHYKDEKLLENALSHSSYANEKHTSRGSNERLEFLGDSVLSLVTADYLYHHYSHIPEGELTKLRASLVCEQALYSFASSLNLGDYLLLGKGERMTGGNKRPSILADAFEAVIASIYLDGGIDEARKFILSFIVPEIEQKRPAKFEDYKTLLQEIIQQNPDEMVEYRVTGESGPDHDKTFTVEVTLNHNVIGRGNGKSKKDAEQKAAKEALALMGK
ncbi:MAG: ribonuclease III [Acutalibacteraceae bacterium]